MEIVIAPAADLSHRAADAIVSLYRTNPQAVLGLATGSSPLGIYDAVAERFQSGDVTFAAGQAFTLDEYVGLETGHPESYREVIIRDLVSKVDLPLEALHTPDGTAGDLSAASQVYDASIAAAGGVDIQILGVGTDGHIAFNEPGSSLASRTRIKTLTERTRSDNSRFFNGDITQVPTHCLTQGIGTILEARHIVLIATGKGKADAVAQFVEGPVTASCPASVLQLHPHVTILVDDDAASKLARRDYYVYTYDRKPDWQGL